MAPVTVMAKIFIQQLWKENLDFHLTSLAETME